MPALDIGNREIGDGQPCFIIAEAGVNHNGDAAMARKLVSAAAEAGADAVKFQTFRAAELVTKDAPKAAYQVASTSAEESQMEMLRRLELTEDDHNKLIEHCRRQGIQFLSTPFDEQSADLLAEFGLPAFKISSGEITNLPLLEHIARKQRPILLSTGMSDMDEVETAVRTLRAQGNDRIVLLQCVSNYPADPADVNLRAMAAMASSCGVLAGYSDHTLGNEVALAAVALGACVIEKHFTLDRNLPGPDHRASLEPAELKALVRSIRIVESCLGDGVKRPAPSEANTREVARRSLAAARDLPAGAKLDKTMMVARRPGTGLPPGMRDTLIGRTLNRNVSSGTLLTLEMFS